MMARKSLRNLAVLGGLGAAAYMAGKKSGASESAEKPQKSAYKGPEEYKDIKGMDVTDETGTKSRLKRNPETGDLYDPEGGGTKPKAEAKPAAKPAAKLAEKEAGVRTPTREAPSSRANEVPPPPKQKLTAEEKPKPKPSGFVDRFKDAMANPDNPRLRRERAELAGEAKPKSPGLIDRFKDAMANPDNPRLRRERAEMGMKKGGMVKSNASKRGDGIAIRGKTRCKVM